MRRPAGNRGAGAGTRHDLTVSAIAAGGEGVGRLADGRVVFVARTAPGDTVRVELVEQKRRWARGRVLHVRESGPARRPAPCPHHARCGGCTLEHLTYAAQLEAKSAIVADALRRIGGLDVAAPAVAPSPSEFQYRNRVSFTLVRSGAGRVVAGFHEPERPARVADIDGGCLLPEPAVAAAWRDLRAGWGENAFRLPAGESLRLTLRASVAGRVSLLVEGGFGDGRPDELLERSAGLVSIWHRPEGGPPRLASGQPALAEQWSGEEVRLEGGVFLQVNRQVAHRLEASVLEACGEAGGGRAIDAYCGVGLHARRLARAGWRVTGIERDPAAVREARRACGEAVEWLEGRVEEHIGGALPAALVVANPPRAGLDGAVIESLLERPARRIVYVSCDPATLARDLARLAPAYGVSGVRCFDMFPQTAHVETLAVLECAIS